MRESPALRRILASTDFSAASLRAVRRAALLAVSHGAELRLLHVVPSASRLSLLTRRGTANRSAMNRAARIALQRVADECAQTTGIRPSLSVVAGAAHATIARVATDDGSDLIVVGAVGEHERLLGRLTGSTALRLLAEMPANLVVVRRPARLEYALQLVAVDLTPRSMHTVVHAARLLPATRLALATCYDLPYAARAVAYGIDPRSLVAAARRNELSMRRELRRVGRTQVPRNRYAGAQILRGDPREQLPEHARRIAADCLTLGSPGRSIADRKPLATFGHVTQQVIDRAAMDVLVVR